MENASKALLIAGAILIAIVLVTIGIIVLGDTGETTDAAKDTASTVEIQTINAQFKKYEGTIDGTEAVLLKNLAVEKKIKINAVSADTFSPVATNKYEVSFSYGNDGAINNITATVI